MLAARRSVPATAGMFEIGICLKTDSHASFANRTFRASAIRC